VKTLLSLIALFVLCVASSLAEERPRPVERVMTPEQFGDIDRLEPPRAPQSILVPHTAKPRKSQPAAQPRPTRHPTSPNYGMDNWGGDPFKPFTSDRPWGRVPYTMGFGPQDSYAVAVQKERFPIVVLVTTEKNGELTVTSIIVKNPLRSQSLEAIIRSAR
jgi:hypothetical protein